MDTYLLKYWAIKLATNAVNTVLRVDQVRLHRNFRGALIKFTDFAVSLHGVSLMKQCIQLDDWQKNLSELLSAKY